MFVSARVIDACGVGIRSVTGVHFCMGRSWVVSEFYALTFQEKVWDVDFCAPEIYQSVYYDLTYRFALKLCLHLHMLTYLQ